MPKGADGLLSLKIGPYRRVGLRIQPPTKTDNTRQRERVSIGWPTGTGSSNRGACPKKNSPDYRAMFTIQKKRESHRLVDGRQNDLSL